jgi:hypothetical protein
MNRAMTNRLTQLPVTFSLLVTYILKNYLPRLIPSVLLALLFTTTATVVEGSPSYPVLFEPVPSPILDTVRIDTVRSEAIHAAEGVAFYNDQVIILSNSKYQQKMVPGHLSFGEDGTYLADPEVLDRTPTKLLAVKDPFAHAPAGMAISTGARVLYYTAPENGTQGKDKIFAVPIEKNPSGSKVTMDPVYAKMLPFCDGSDTYRHPAVTENNEFMIFASDRKGSMGGFDLFLVQKEGDGWGRIVHMGNEINSVKDELYPFLDSEKNLFYSSAGHSGFGGHDIYMCRYTGDGWERPINLMNVINSEGDDIGLKIAAANNTGFFTSIDIKGNKTGKLFKLQPNQQGHLSGEILAMALTSFEEMFGVAFTSSAEQKMTIPQAFQVREVQAELSKADETQDKDDTEDKAEKRVDEVSQTDPTPQEFTAARKDPVKPPVQKKPDVQKEQKATEEFAAATPPEKTKVVEPTETTVTTVTTVTTETSQTTETTKTDGMQTDQADAEAAEIDVQQEEAQAEEKDAVIFRVQITSTRSSVAGKKITIDGRSYTVFEYNYKGAYRQTVGAFRDLDEAKAFQTKCRNAGYSQAFVAAFINDERVTDPAVFKR